MKKVLWFSFLLLFVGCVGPGMFANEEIYTEEIDGRNFQSQSFAFFEYPLTEESKKKFKPAFPFTRNVLPGNVDRFDICEDTEEYQSDTFDEEGAGEREKAKDVKSWLNKIYKKFRSIVKKGF